MDKALGEGLSHPLLFVGMLKISKDIFFKEQKIVKKI
jgi:hypothetical protein